MSTHQDLDWDHSVGENLIDSTLLDGQQFEDVAFFNGLANSENSGERAVRISRFQLAFLLRSLDDASSLLKEQRNLQDAEHMNQSRPAMRSVSTNACSKWGKKFLHNVITYNLLITFVLQAIMLVILTIIDSSLPSKSKNSISATASSVIMLLLMAVNLVVIVLITVKVTRKFLHSNTSTWMLAQAYMSTVLVFAGFYFVTYRMNKKGWSLHGFNKAADDSETIIAVYLFLKMLYLSISTSTLCDKSFKGTSTIHPDEWYNFLLMSLQMLLSFVYFTSILSLTLGTKQIPVQSHMNGVARRQRTYSLNSQNSLVSTEHSRLLGGGNETATTYGGL